ncbi:MAG TPA: isoprenoid biosynthesis glyoxalase ElbB [Phycisphaerae bacterium]|nr:isoprenoid biosynthesis glyoxalase ElbB [Phycisphaerae bacterium]
MARVGVCLSGCGVYDGSEIHEAVLTLLALDQAKAEIVCCAPNIDQPAVVNHLDHSTTNEKRNVLVESARIARGKIRDLATVKADDIDALIFPGGFGAAKNLCTFVDEGPDCKVNPQVERLVGEMLDARKPVAAICIAPAMLARILGRRGVKAKVTIGTDAATAGAIEKMGLTHLASPCVSFVVDAEHKIVTTPAYMLGQGPAEVFEGIRGLVGEVMKLISG